MVKQASEVVKKIDSLPQSEQELLAKYLAAHFDDVLEDARWEQFFAQSPSILDRFAAEVDQAIATGDVDELNPDEL
jgi:hypothetical protein